MDINFILFRSLLIYIISIWSNYCCSQVAINNSGLPPNTHAILDINSIDKGVLIPRINLVDTSNPIGASKPIGLLVWNGNSSFDKGRGFYFWSGTQWRPIVMIYKAGNGITIDSASNTINSIASPINTVDTSGIVPAPTSAKRYAQYKTDFKGNPAWRKENKTMYYIEKF